jgi:hypothetical protein
MTFMGSKTKISALSTYIPIPSLVYMVEAYIFDTYPIDETVEIKDKLAIIFHGVDICNTIKKINSKGITSEHVIKFPSDIDEIYYYDFTRSRIDIEHDLFYVYGYRYSDEHQNTILVCRNAHGIYFILKHTINNLRHYNSRILCKSTTKLSLTVYKNYENMLNALKDKFPPYVHMNVYRIH